MNLANAQAIARLLEASALIPNMVVKSGSVLFIKVTDAMGSRVCSVTLTATQLRVFEESTHLLSDPQRALAFLESALPSVVSGHETSSGAAEVRKAIDATVDER